VLDERLVHADPVLLVTDLRVSGHCPTAVVVPPASALEWPASVGSHERQLRPLLGSRLYYLHPYCSDAHLDDDPHWSAVNISLPAVRARPFSLCASLTLHAGLSILGSGALVVSYTQNSIA
jgi:hypothetical protein